MNCGQSSIYQPGNSQDAQRYSVSPFQKIVIQLGTNAGGLVDRTNGELFPQYEGESVFVEQSDYPVYISLISASSGDIQQTFLARNGLNIVGPFKGLIVYHPALTFPAGSGYSQVRLVLGKQRATAYENQEANPGWGLPPSILSAVAAGAINHSILVPKGAKFLTDFRITFYATTVTGAYWDSVADVAAAAVAGITPAVPYAGINFNSTNSLTGFFEMTQTVSGFWVAKDSNIPIPADCAYLRAFFAGTIMSTGAGCAVKAAFQ